QIFKTNLSIRRIRQRWEATRAPRWTRIPQAGVEILLRPGMPICGIDPKAINPMSLNPKSILAPRSQTDISAEPVQNDLVGGLTRDRTFGRNLEDGLRVCPVAFVVEST